MNRTSWLTLGALGLTAFDGDLSVGFARFKGKFSCAGRSEC